MLMYAPGLIPCVNLEAVKTLVHYTTQQEAFQFLDIKERTALALAGIIGVGITGAATGGTALRQIEKVEITLRHMKASLDSLAEMVLQNRRGLDLLALEQGGICQALGEKCYSYADHSGVITKNLDNLRNSLKRKKTSYSCSR